MEMKGKSDEVGASEITEPIIFKAEFEGKPDKEIEIAGYLFDAQGALIAISSLREGETRFSINPKRLKRARFFWGPKIPAERKPKNISIQKMQQLMAYEPVWRYETGKKVYSVLPIVKAYWRWWLWCKCRVNGTLLKRVYSGGVTYEAPVCSARVHICEVDRIPMLVARLPDDIIVRLRDELFKVWQRPPYRIPEPEPDPWFQVYSGVIDPSPEVFRETRLLQMAQVMGHGKLASSALNPQPEPPGKAVAVKATENLPAGVMATRQIGQLGPQPEPPDLPMPALSIETRMALESRSVAVVRQALIDHIELIRPWVCAWPWLWPYFYFCDELAVVTTDKNGRFAADIWYLCAGDHPDLYFWVEYSIGGVWETVYKPGVPCHTHWNYSCASEVTIRITDPRVPGCGASPTVYGKKVVIKSIGREVSMSEIFRESEDSLKDGTVKPGWLHASKNSPFGRILQPRVDFGNGLKGSGITHYRWSYRQLGSEDEGDWKVIDAPVSRHYLEASAPGDPAVYKSLQIGPSSDVTGYFVEIDPELPANAEDWEVLDERYDLSSAHFDTTGILPGKYEMKLELFKKVGTTMQRVDFGMESVELYETSSSAPFTMEEIALVAPPEERKLIETIGTVSHVYGYRLVVHIDNRQCFGTITAVTVAPGMTDTKCGFLEYGPGASATLSFRARHDDDFAYFDFDVVRVNRWLDAASAFGLVGAAAINGYSRVGDTFSKTLPVAGLLSENLPAGDIPCVRAAFAESLWVYALATDGYERLYYLDAPRSEDPLQIRLRGFALTPQEE